MRAGARNGATDDQCASGCWEYDAKATVPGVETVSADGVPLTIGLPYFFESKEVRIGDCVAYYTLGVMPVREAFLEQRPDLTASDYMLFREIRSKGDAGLCEPSGGGSPDDSRGDCHDTWFVRVTDSSGKQVTKDYEGDGTPSPDAGR